MKFPIFLSFSDNKGGASIAAYSLFKALKKIFKVKFYCINGNKNDTIKNKSILNICYVNCLRIFEKFLISFFLKKEFHQSLNIFKSFNSFFYKESEYNLINIHWVNRSIISLKEILDFNTKVVISLHDMWFLNSTEHYFIKRTKTINFIDAYCWKLKIKIISKKNVFFIAHNKWMLSKYSSIFPQFKNKIFLCNYYPIDLSIFKPRNKNKLRIKYNLPLNKKIILFSAQDIKDDRKGHKYFVKIKNKLSKKKDIFFISLGNLGQKLQSKNSENYKHIDFCTNKESAEIYSLSDIYLSTSKIDNLSLSVLEALSSGNVVISFDNGGAKEVLNKHGYIFKISELERLIGLLKDIKKKEIDKKSKLSRKFAEQNFSFKKIGKQYSKIFKEILSMN